MKHFPTLLCLVIALLAACERSPQAKPEQKAQVTPEMMADALFIALRCPLRSPSIRTKWSTACRTWQG